MKKIEIYIANIKQFSSEQIFNLLVSELATIHDSEVRDIIFSDSKIRKIRFILRNFIFVLLSVRYLRLFNDEAYKNSEENHLIYYSNRKKTTIERDNLDKYINARGLYWQDIKKIKLPIKYFIGKLLLDLSVLFQIIRMILNKNYGLSDIACVSGAFKYTTVYSKWCFLFDNNSFNNVINFFSSTSEGHILNYVAMKKGVNVITYSWGSNAPSLEHHYTVQDCVLLKYRNEIGKYKRGKEFLLGDLGIEIIDSRVEKKYDICIVDTCTNMLFSEENKYSFYKELFDNLNFKKAKRILISAHPASELEKISDIVNCYKDTFDIFVSNGKAIDNIVMSKVSINICSTILNTVLIPNRIPFVNLSKIYFEQYLKIKTPSELMSNSISNDFEFMEQLNKIDFISLEQYVSRSNVSFFRPDVLDMVLLNE
ncbi:hypothetical protein ACUSRQ_003502 [Vibrio harveyi]